MAGRSWRQWGEGLADDTVNRIESELRQSVTLGEGIPDTAKRLRTVASLSRQSSVKLARTAINATANRARVQAIEEGFGSVVAGWQFTATLDGRTSSICAGLDGTRYRKGDPSIPYPPRHPNCRSVMVPLTDLEEPLEGERPFVQSTEDRKGRERQFRAEARERVGQDQWSGLSEKERRDEIRVQRERFNRNKVGQVPARTTFEDWFKRQPESFQRERLGPTRFAAFKRGLPITSLANADRPLTVAELRNLYPSEVR